MHYYQKKGRLEDEGVLLEIKRDFTMTVQSVHQGVMITIICKCACANRAHIHDENLDRFRIK